MPHACVHACIPGRTLWTAHGKQHRAAVTPQSLPLLHLSAAAEHAQPGWFERVFAGKGSSLALAFLCSKAMVPIKLPVAAAITPYVHRCGLAERGSCQARSACSWQARMHLCFVPRGEAPARAPLAFHPDAGLGGDARRVTQNLFRGGAAKGS